MSGIRVNGGGRDFTDMDIIKVGWQMLESPEY